MKISCSAKTTATALACALTLSVAGTAIAQDNLFIYDFNALDAGEGAAVQLTDNPADYTGGQDNWWGINAISYCRNDFPGNSYSPCIGITGGDVQGMRMNDENWDYSIPDGKIFYFGALMRIQSDRQTLLSLTSVEGTREDYTQTNYVAGFIGYRRNPNGWCLRTRDGVQHSSNDPAPPATGEFWNVLCRVDPTANDGNGSGQILVMDPLNNPGIWRKVKGLDNIDMLFQEGSALEPLVLSDLNSLYTRFYGNTGLDDIFISIPMGVADSNPFGAQVAGYTFAVPETVTIRNQADTDLTIASADAITLEGSADFLPDFTLDLSGVTFPVTIAPGGSFSGITVTYDPTGNVNLGDRDVQVTIVTNDALPIWVPLGGSLGQSPQTGLVAYLPLDQNVNEEVGTADLNVDFMGTPLYDTTDPMVGTGAAHLPADPASYISLSNGAGQAATPIGDLLNAHSFTIGGWYKLVSDDSGVQAIYPYWANKNHRHADLGVSMFNWSNWGVNTNRPASSYPRDSADVAMSLHLNSDGTMYDGGWHYLAISYSYGGGISTITVDGQARGADASEAWGGQENFNSNYPLNIGQSGAADANTTNTGDDGYRVMNFMVDDFAIWDRPLSSSDLAQIVVNGQSGIALGDIRPLPAMFAEVDGPPYAWLEAKTTQDYTVTIKNDGNYPLTIAANQMLTGSDEFDFDPSYDPSVEKIVFPNQSLAVPIVWTVGTEPGPRTANLVFNHDDETYAGGYPTATIAIETYLADRAAQPVALAQDLLLHAEFEDNLLDSSPNNNDGYTSDTIGDTGYAEGIIGRAFMDLALAESSTDGLVYFPNNETWDPLVTGDFSLSMWILAEFPTQSPDDRGTFIDKWDSDTGIGFLMARTGQFNPIGWRTRIQGTSGNVELDTFRSGYIGSGRWLHVAFSADRSGKLTLYEDGMPVTLNNPDPADSLTGIGELTETVPLMLGRNLNHGNANMPDMPFLADDLAVWTRVVEPWEMEFIYDEGMQGRTFVIEPGPSAARNDWNMYE